MAVTLKDLLIAGALTQGEELLCEPRQGETYKAKLLGDGSIASEGKQYLTPSEWASKVAGGQRNGWRDIKARGQPLASYRASLQDRVGLMEEKKPIDQPARSDSVPPPTLQAQAPSGDPQAALLSRLQILTPTQFEHLVGAFLRAKGIMEVQVTQRSHDGGIDAIGVVPFVDVKVAVQAKRYANGTNVGIDPVQRLKGSMSGGYERGVFITTSAFTNGAKSWVEETKAAITLVDGQQLVREMVELNLGVKPLTVTAAIDEDFFKSLGSS